MYKVNIVAIISIITLMLSKNVIAQKDTLDSLLDITSTPKNYIKNAFKSNRIINSHSIEFIPKGAMDLRILHRFGLLSDGLNNFLGLDEATMRMSFDFGVLENVQIGVGRSTFKKEFDGYFKYAIVRQQEGNKIVPITLALASGITINSYKSNDANFNKHFSNRVAYYMQVLLGKKFNNNLSLQIMPGIVHNNYTIIQPNDIYSIGMGGRLKISKRVALTLDYCVLLNGKMKDVNYNPLSIGVDIETGGHVFQLHVSNANGTNERAIITETTNQFTKGQISFGFNISRMFQIKKQKL
jgi:hypothetical protein